MFLLAGSQPVWAYTENDADRLSADVRHSSGFALSSLRVISQKELAQIIEEKREKKISFSLVDLRLETDYQKGHLPGAVNIPLQKLRFLAEVMLQKDEQIFFYGYSREDQASVNAVILLANKGFKRMALLEEGVDGWKGKLE